MSINFTTPKSAINLTMTESLPDPSVENIQWTLSELFNYNKAGVIHKPACNRTMNWPIKADINKPDEPAIQPYLENVFMLRDFGTQLVLWQPKKKEDYQVMDANHRNNANLMGWNEPHLIFNEFFQDFEKFVSDSQDLKEELKIHFLNIVKDIKLQDIQMYSFTDIFINDFEEIKKIWRKVENGTVMDIDAEWREVKKKFKFGHKTPISPEKIKVPVKIYKYYPEHIMIEQCKQFNTKSTPWTNIHIISAGLGAIYIQEENIPNNIRNECKILIAKYYETRNSKFEKYTNQYKVGNDYRFTAFDFLYSFMEYLANKFDNNIISPMNFDKASEIDNNKDPWIFIIYKVFSCNNDPNWQKEEYFTPEKINTFIEACEKAFRQLNDIYEEMFFTLNKEGRQTSTSIIGKGTTKYITGKGQTNIIAATKVTDWYSTQTKYIISLLLSPTWNNTQKQKKQFIIGRFFNIFAKCQTLPADAKMTEYGYTQPEIDDWKDKLAGWKEKDIFDSGSTKNRGCLEDTVTRIFKDADLHIRNGVHKEVFMDLLVRGGELSVRKMTDKEEIVDATPRKNKHRKQMSKTDMLLIGQLNMNNVNVKFLRELRHHGAMFHNDHIYPHSMRSDEPIRFTPNRLGNYSPIMDKLNIIKGNKSVSEFIELLKSKPEYKNTLEFIEKTGLYNEKKYDDIIFYKEIEHNRVPFIKKGKLDELNNIFKQNEIYYYSDFLDSLYNFEAEN